MDAKVRELAERLLSAGYDDLPESEQLVLRRIAARAAISRDLGAEIHAGESLGDRVADRVASFGGSWTFLILFAGVVLGWVALNVALWSRAVDPYPFVFLNLILSMLAAVQAPVIMMSQNRQATKDRLTMQHDYEVNLKAELEIMSLHEKLDDLRLHHLEAHFARLEQRLDAIEAALTAGRAV